MIPLNTKQFIKLTSILLFGSFFLSNCEPDADNLGEQFLLGNASQGNEISYDVTAYNINNNDTIRSDASTLFLTNSGRLGAFTESVFGMQKASYVSQVRMSSYAPDFGENPEVDSVVLVLNPSYAADSAETITDDDYIFPKGDVAAKKVITKYPVAKYGKQKINGEDTKFNIRVYEVNEFLKSTSEAYYSNQIVGYNPTEIGSKVFDGYVNSTSVTQDSDNAALFTHETSLRIPLNNTFFQNKIIAKEGTTDLQDAANFIRYFNGIRVSVDETDGYLFNFNSNSAKIVMYYSKDATDGREQTTFEFPLGSTQANSNNFVHIGQYEYNRTGTTVAEALASSNSQIGDPKLYPQGMGGPSVGIRIPDATISELRKKVNEEKIAIISSRIRIFTDNSIWNNNFAKPQTFTFLMKEATAFMEDMSMFANNPNFALVKAYNTDSNPAYYDFTITKSLKDVVESNEENKDFILEMGGFLANSSGTPYGYQYTSRVVDPHRLVLVGTDPTNENRIQLKVIYGSK